MMVLKKKKQNDRTQTVLYIAQLLAKGKGDLVKQMIKSDPTLIHSSDTQNLTPLHHCCNEGNFELAKWLVRHNASITDRDQKGWNPLHCVAASQIDADTYIKICNLLLETESADRALMAKTDSGSTFLHYILGNRHLSDADLDVLLKRSIELHADVDAQSEKGDGPLHRAAMTGRVSACKILISQAGMCIAYVCFGV
mgnify:CR=1 FL=1